MKRTAFLLTAALMLWSAPLKAAPMTFEMDKTHTQILFSISHFGFSYTYGKFLDFDGTFTFDPDNRMAGGTTDVTIQTASVDVGDAPRNKHLKTADFFNVAKYPTMTFKSTRVSDIRGDHAQLTGDLTMLGVTRPVTLKVELHKCEKSPMNQELVCGFAAEGELKRSDWGMDFDLPGVGDTVKMRIQVEGSPIKKQMEARSK